MPHLYLKFPVFVQAYNFGCKHHLFSLEIVNIRGIYMRRRGVILTEKGFKKLHQAKAKMEVEQDFKRYTLEALSEETGLTPTTLSKVFTGSAGVDKRTLRCCFGAFDLTLIEDDYLYLKPAQDNLAKIAFISPAETFYDCAPICDFPNTSRTQTMARQQDNLQPCPPAVPVGQISVDSRFYIDRPILKSLCYKEIGQPGSIVNICAPKQMGKTSLMRHILAYAKTQGFHTVSLSLQLPDAEIIQNLDRFLRWFCARVSKQLGLPNQTSKIWDSALGSKSSATDYFEDVLLVRGDREVASRNHHPLVITIDDLNQLFADPKIAGEFLILLRTWSEKAKLKDKGDNPWQKLRLVTVQSTEMLRPSSLAPAILNPGLVIKLPEFTPAQVQDLAHRYEQALTEPHLDQLMVLVGGHPYRLQLAFNFLQQQNLSLSDLLENAAIAATVYSEHLQQQYWDLQRYPDLLPIFTQIVSTPNPIEIETSRGYQLQEMGLVHLEGKRASLACELFRPFFRRILN